MITVIETSPGVFEPISGNPTLTSLDGKVRAPLQAILHESWTAEDRAAFGVYVVEPATIPDGKVASGSPRYERKDVVVIEVRDLEDAPPPLPEPTPQEKVQVLAASFGLTLAQLREVLLDGGAQ